MDLPPTQLVEKIDEMTLFLKFIFLIKKCYETTIKMLLCPDRLYRMYDFPSSTTELISEIALIFCKKLIILKK